MSQNLVIAIKALAEEGFEVKFELHPVRFNYMGITLKKNGAVQHAHIELDKFSEDWIVGCLGDCRERINNYIRSLG